MQAQGEPRSADTTRTCSLSQPLSFRGEKTGRVKRRNAAPLFISSSPAEGEHLMDPLRVSKETFGSLNNRMKLKL